MHRQKIKFDDWNSKEQTNMVMVRDANRENITIYHKLWSRQSKKKEEETHQNIQENVVSLLI